MGDTVADFSREPRGQPGGRASYRRRFVDAKEAASYDEGEYSPETYPALLWKLEQRFLEQVVAALRQDVPTIDYLDFACGTGRILAFMEPLVDSATGVEISNAMLERARLKIVRARLIHRDITQGEPLSAGPFDLITAFRFVLNAEPELRVAAMRKLAALLRDEQSLLVFNSHINLWSHKLATWPTQKIRQPHGKGNFLTFRQVRKLASDCGLTVELGYGCGFLSRRALRPMSHERLYNLEERLSQAQQLHRFGSDQIYVARRML